MVASLTTVSLEGKAPRNVPEPSAAEPNQASSPPFCSLAPSTPLLSAGNPIASDRRYRQRVLEAAPQVTVLDDEPVADGERGAAGEDGEPAGGLPSPGVGALLARALVRPHMRPTSSPVSERHLFWVWVDAVSTASTHSNVLSLSLLDNHQRTTSSRRCARSGRRRRGSWRSYPTGSNTRGAGWTTSGRRRRWRTGRTATDSVRHSALEPPACAHA